MVEVTVISGDDLIAIDWKGSCSSDPYCVVVAYPQSPSVDGRVEAEWHRSKTVDNTSSPRWDYKVEFDIHWTKAGTEQWMAADMRQTGYMGTPGVESCSPIASAPMRKSRIQYIPKTEAPEPNEKEKRKILETDVPLLKQELWDLRESVVPQIRRDIYDVQRDLELIVSALRKRGLQSKGSMPAPAPSTSATQNA